MQRNKIELNRFHQYKTEIILNKAASQEKTTANDYLLVININNQVYCIESKF